ncbi:hypothetical protein HPB51_007056 [Rhipicephalus microplus]|uniref:FHA domain-containing protein n=1 Tax=Rhipicephalus microplus TaxID=6941 RepID=A0A9J6DSZ0_RHIMP|nr:hypothetical protein HPB51_007056 [Rhipicephalus microplus]
MVDAWRLVRRGGSTYAKSEIVLDCENVVIGRNVQPKYRLDSVNISRQHACLKYSSGNGQWDITDLRSHNGVFVNGKKIPASHPFALHEGDVIGFGKPAPSGDDVFVFTLTKCEGVAVKSELPDPPRAVPPASDVLLSSDDDDIVVTKMVIAKRRPTVSTSSDCVFFTNASLSTTLPAAPLPVETKKEPFVEDDSLSYGASSASTSRAVGAAHTSVAATANTSFKTSPRHQVLRTAFASSSKTVPSEAVGRVKIERDCDSTDSRSSCSRDTQCSRLSVPVALTADTRNSPTATLPALSPHAPHTFIKQEVPEHTVGIESFPTCEPAHVARYIKQEPDDLGRVQAHNVQRTIVTSAHQSAFCSDVPRQDINDVIIILSDSDDDCSVDINLEIKKEAEEAEEMISNDADVEAGIPWMNDCLNDFVEETKAVCSIAEDGDLEKRLVWNESEPEQATVDKEQPENDFFPVLSQGFSQEEADPPEIKERSSSADVFYSSSFCHSARSGGREKIQAKIPKKAPRKNRA